MTQNSLVITLWSLVAASVLGLSPCALAACPGDFDGDGFVTGDDFDLYADAFITGTPAADFNGDGFVTGDDFDAYVEEFSNGCRNELYVNGRTGSDLAAGARSAPFQSVSRALESVISGTTVYVADRIYADFVNVPDLSGVVITQWPGAASAEMVGLAPPLSGWTSKGLYYTTTVPVGISITSVLVNTDNPPRDARGRALVHLVRAFSEELVAFTSNSWFYTNSTGTLAVRIGSNDDPAGFTVNYAKGGYDALLKLTNATQCTVSHLRFAYHCDGRNGKGYGVWISGTENLIADDDFEELGYHSAGFVSNTPGTPNLNNSMLRCTARGLFLNTGAESNHFVTYGGGGPGSDPTNTTIKQCSAYCYTSLRRNGPPLFSSAISCNGFYGHAGVSNVVRGLVVEDCSCIRSGGPGDADMSKPFNCGSLIAPPAPDDPASYVCRFINCTTVGSPQIRFDNAEYISYERCRFETSDNATWDGGSKKGTGCYRWYASSAITFQRFENCELVGDTGALDFGILFHIGTGQQPRMTTSSCYLKGSGQSPQMLLIDAPDRTRITARGTVFASQSTAGQSYFMVFAQGTPTVDNWDLLDNFYYNQRFTLYPTNALYDALDTIDPTALIVESPTTPFADPTGSTLDLTPSARAATRSTSPHGPFGINALPYSSNYGAWQYGP